MTDKKIFLVSEEQTTVFKRAEHYGSIEVPHISRKKVELTPELEEKIIQEISDNWEKIYKQPYVNVRRKLIKFTIQKLKEEIL